MPTQTREYTCGRTAKAMRSLLNKIAAEPLADVTVRHSETRVGCDTVFSVTFDGSSAVKAAATIDKYFTFAKKLVAQPQTHRHQTARVLAEHLLRLSAITEPRGDVWDVASDAVVGVTAFL